MMIVDILTVVCLVFGCIFFVAGTLGLLRFPDIYTRIHALTKADNVGLGFILLALMLQDVSLAAWLELLVIWLLIQVSGASVAHMIARNAMKKGLPLWRR